MDLKIIPNFIEFAKSFSNSFIHSTIKTYKMHFLNKNVCSKWLDFNYFYTKSYILSIRYRTNVYEVDESYTSQCCSLCGILLRDYDNQIKKCKYCGLKMDRDSNESRNIYVKSICSTFGMKAKLASLKCQKIV